MKTKRLKSEKQDCRCYHWNGKAFHETKTNRSLLQQKKQTKAITKGCRASSFYWNQLFKMLKLLYLDHWELMRFGKFYLLGVVLAVHPILIHNQAYQLISRTQRPKGHWIHFFFPTTIETFFLHGELNNSHSMFKVIIKIDRVFCSIFFQIPVFAIRWNVVKKEFEEWWTEVCPATTRCF